MKIYIAENGDCSAGMVVVANDAKEARKIIRAKIKKEELQETFPVILLTKHELTPGIKHEIHCNSF